MIKVAQERQRVMICERAGRGRGEEKRQVSVKRRKRGKGDELKLE
jgi:hypothetical protein